MCGIVEGNVMETYKDIMVQKKLRYPILVPIWVLSVVLLVCLAVRNSLWGVQYIWLWLAFGFVTGLVFQRVSVKRDISIYFADDELVILMKDMDGKHSEGYRVKYTEILHFKETSFGLTLQGCLQAITPNTTDRVSLRLIYGYLSDEDGVWKYPKKLEPLMSKYANV